VTGEYRIRQTVTDQFVVERLVTRETRVWFRTKVETKWCGLNVYGNTAWSNGLYPLLVPGVKFWKTLAQANKAISRFKRGQIIHASRN
jgi:hypothetical protein